MELAEVAPTLEEWIEEIKKVSAVLNPLITTEVYGFDNLDDFHYERKGIKFHPPQVKIVYKLTQLETEQANLSAPEMVAAYVIGSLHTPSPPEYKDAVLCFMLPQKAYYDVANAYALFYITASYTLHSS